MSLKQISWICRILILSSGLLSLAFRPSTERRHFNTGYFFFELTSTATGKPYYFSQVVALTYDGGQDLRDKQDSCVKLLRTAAGNPDNYNDTGSTEGQSADDSNVDRASNIKHLREAGYTVIEKNI